MNYANLFYHQLCQPLVFQKIFLKSKINFNSSTANYLFQPRSSLIIEYRE